MRTIWKRAAYLTLFTAGITLGAVSCTDTATSPQKFDAAHSGKPAADRKVHELRAKYGWPADYHTRALDYAYAQLIRQNAGSLPAASRCRLAEAALKDFHKAYRKDGQQLPVADVSFAGTVCDKGAKKQIIDPSERLGAPRRNEMSADATALLAQVDAAVDNNESVESIRSAIYAIEGTAAANLGELEAGALIAAGEVTISSAEYWETNQDDWESNLGGGEDLPIVYGRDRGNSVVSKIVVTAPGTHPRFGLTDRQKRIIKADVGAFIGTIVYEWFTGPVAWSKAAWRAGAASIAAGVLPY